MKCKINPPLLIKIEVLVGFVSEHLRQIAKQESAEATVKNIRRRTRKKYSAEEKMRIVIEGLKGESTVAEFCRFKITIDGPN